MARIAYAPEVFDDFDRIFDHVASTSPADAPGWLAELLEAVEILSHSPLIGRPFRDGKRELVIGRGSRGYVALYRYVPDLDTAFVLAFRSQREAGFRHQT
jgi:plasmid stabilization system protein ParE